MAAAASPGTAFGIKPSKVLLRVFFLLSLVYLTHSLIRIEHLEILQEYYEGGLEDAAEKRKDFKNKLKVEAEIFEEDLERYTPKLKQLKADTKNSSSLEGLMMTVNKFIVEKRKDFTRENKALSYEIDAIWDFIQLQEDDELY